MDKIFAIDFGTAYCRAALEGGGRGKDGAFIPHEADIGNISSVYYDNGQRHASF